MEIPREELKIEFFRATGHGGQNVNKVETACRITHLPTGITATSQDERSKTQNAKRALNVLRARVAIKRQAERKEQVDAFRNAQLNSGRVRTYNFFRNEIVDHRSGKKTRRVADVMDGDIDLVRE